MMLKLKTTGAQILFWLGYVIVAGGYLLLVGHESSAWRAERQKRVEESPEVWVAPYGIHYHQERHYGRHLGSPLSLYEATERGYEHCGICDPPSRSAHTLARLGQALDCNSRGIKLLVVGCVCDSFLQKARRHPTGASRVSCVSVESVAN